MTARRSAAYADADGARMYYEATGAGYPLVLLHGGFGGVHVFGGQVPAFAERHRVLAPEQRGRGHTADVAGPITYQILADDIIAFLERTVGEPAHLVGVSDGGIVGLLVAMQRPNLLRKLVTVGANFHRDGLMGSMWTDASRRHPDAPSRTPSSVCPTASDLSALPAQHGKPAGLVVSGAIADHEPLP